MSILSHSTLWNSLHTFMSQSMILTKILWHIYVIIKNYKELNIYIYILCSWYHTPKICVDGMPCLAPWDVCKFFVSLCFHSTTSFFNQWMSSKVFGCNTYTTKTIKCEIHWNNNNWQRTDIIDKSTTSYIDHWYVVRTSGQNLIMKLCLAFRKVAKARWIACKHSTFT